MDAFAAVQSNLPNSAWIWLFLALAAFWAAQRYRAGRARSRYERDERARMPAEIAGGRLVLSEVYMRCDAPRLGARVDQVYLTTVGLVPVDTKTRSRGTVTAADVIELSVQAVVLGRARPRSLRDAEVAGYGYVRLVVMGRPVEYRRVELLSAEEVAGLRSRYLSIAAGGPVRFAGKPYRCVRCPFATRCPAGQQVARHRAAGGRT